MRLGFLVLLVLFASTAHAGQPALPCAVEGLSRGVKPDELCQALAGELTRSVVVVDDARSTTQGEAIEVITGDVSWTLVWLRDGRVRTWTRVSKLDSVSEQVKLLARAARELAKAATSLGERDSTCLRVDASKARNLDLSYPWAELSPCKRKVVEVPDPWWLPPRSSGAP